MFKGLKPSPGIFKLREDTTTKPIIVSPKILNNIIILSEDKCLEIILELI